MREVANILQSPDAHFAQASPSGVRRQAMVVAGQAGAIAAEGVLAHVQAGQPPVVKPLPSVPPEEEDTKDTDEDVVGGDSPDSELAAVALGRMRSPRTRP